MAYAFKCLEAYALDLAGLNAISRKVIGNAAHAVAGMALHTPQLEVADKPGVGMNMFGVTTACVTMVRDALEEAHEVYVFHATGTGGQSMESLQIHALPRPGCGCRSFKRHPLRLAGGAEPTTRGA